MAHPATSAPRRGRTVAGILGAVALVCAGVLVGRSMTGTTTATHVETTTVTVERGTATTTPAPAPAGFAQTREGASAAAAAYLTAFDGETLFDATRLQATIDRVVATSARQQVAAAYAGAVADLRHRFGLDGQPTPVVIMRAAPLGYRVASYSDDRATIEVWDVGVLGSGAGLDPAASWRTDRVDLVWEEGTWKATAFGSAPGPTPALAAPGGVTPPGDVFSTVPGFAPYAHVAP